MDRKMQVLQACHKTLNRWILGLCFLMVLYIVLVATKEIPSVIKFHHFSDTVSIYAYGFGVSILLLQWRITGNEKSSASPKTDTTGGGLWTPEGSYLRWVKGCLRWVKDSTWFTEQNQLQMRIALLLFLLAILVYLSGGFLDSPFSGASSLFVATFIAFQTKKETERELGRFNYGLVFLFLLLMSIPYILSYFCYGTPAYCSWRTDDAEIALWVIVSRYVVTVLLLVVTGLAAAKVNDELPAH